MNHVAKWVFPAIAFYCLVNFSCNDKITYPAPQYPINLLTNSAFEVNGKPSLDGWNVFYTNDIHLSTDVPPGKAGYSAVVDNGLDTVYLSEPPPLMYQVVRLPYGKHVYRLSFWTKNEVASPYYVEGCFIVPLYRGDTMAWEGWTFYTDDTSWTFYSAFSDTFDVQQPENFVAWISEPNCDSIGARTWYYDVKLEVMNQSE